MSRTMLWGHVVLCVLALGFAWQRAHEVQTKQGGPSSVVLLDADVGEIQEVTFVSADGTVIITPSGKDEALAAVVTVDRLGEEKKPDKKKKKAAEDAAKDAAKDGDAKDGDEVPEAIEATPPREQATFPGQKSVLTALRDLAPLKSKRTLGVVDAAQLEAMGFAGEGALPIPTLTVKTSRRTVVLEVGAKSYGSQGHYVRIKGESVVHLIDSSVLSGVDGGVNALLEKRPLTAELEAIKGFAVTLSADTVRYLHVNRDQASTRFVARADAPESRDDVAGKVLTSLRNLRGTALATPEEMAAAGATVGVFSVDLEHQKPLVITLVAGGDDGGGYLAKAGAYGWRLTPTSAKELIDDATSAVTGQ